MSGEVIDRLGFRKFSHPGMRIVQRLLLCGIPILALPYNFELFSWFGLVMLQEQYLGLLLTVALAAVFLSVPAWRGAPSTKASWYDFLLAALSAVVGGYLVVYYPQIVTEVGELTPDKVVLGMIAFFLIMEACRRMVGWILVIIAAVFIFYAHYSHLFPGFLNARGISWSKIAVHLYIDPNALLGIPLAIAGTIVVAFIVFGQVLYASGGGDFFTDLAMAAMGRFRGGAAKIAVFSSALFGTISGSAVANVVVDGAITIPMMKRTGYKPEVAGAIESVASNGGQIMPPVMGATAFVMAQFLGLPYAEVAIAAFIPAILYYLALFIQVDLEAGKTGIVRMPPERLPRVIGVLKNGWIFIIPMGAIVYILFVLNVNAAKAGFYATAIALGVTLFRRDIRINLTKFLAILEDSGRTMLELVVISAVAGLVIGVLTLTGLAFVFTMFVERLGQENMFLILVLTAVISLFLGMGMPTTAVYVIVALTLAPALVKLGILPIAAHLFVFYWAMLSLITPPICVAAYAGAAIAQTSPMRTGYACMRLGVLGYLIPFIFVFDPLLLFQGPVGLVFLVFATAVVGTAAIGIAMAGYFVRPIGWMRRLLMLAGGVALLIPPGGAIEYSWTLNVIGGAVTLGIIAFEWHSRKNPALPPEVAVASQAGGGKKG
jgi:TRAP transporter 4TM/12TM fusion protein